MVKKTKKAAPVKAPVRRRAAPVVRVGESLGVVVEDEAPAAQVGRADRHPRTGRPRG